MKRRLRCLPLLLLLLACVACVQMKYVSFDELVPPKFIVPEGKSVAVLNNFNRHNVELLNEYLEVTPCDGDSLMEYVAMAMADEGLFSEVIVLDSCLYPENDTTAHVLTQYEVKQLCSLLQVDMLYVCEFACLTVEHFDDDTDRNRYLLSTLYVPTRTRPAQSFILCEPVGKISPFTSSRPERLVATFYDKFGDMAVKGLSCQWETRQRSFYTGLNRTLRDAELYVKENNWEAAVDTWRTYAEGGKDRRRLMALYNEALYNEVIDSIPRALECLAQAKTFATDTTSVDSAKVDAWNWAFEADTYPYTDFQRIRGYERILNERASEISKLRLLGM